MAESNWALGENGAAIAAVSHEASHVTSPAENLLVDREDQLWITGDAPQHVTLLLDAAHPPLQYAGWHVWHDYLTNPKRVEVASGETVATLAPLLVCQALPGAGTQVWKLPKPIPSTHRCVRFTIAETFGPGPTYMNNVVLLANDPGPNFCGSAPAAAAVAATGVSPSSSSLARASEAGEARGPALQRGGGGGGSANTAEHHTSPRGRSLDDRPPRAAVVSPRPSARRAPYETVGDDAVGVFTRPARTAMANTPTAPGLSTPTSGSGAFAGGAAAAGGAPNSGRMSQLLRDLDEDIRSLRPIKTVSPKKDMLLYVPQNQPMLLAGQPVSDEGSDGESDRRGRHRHHRSRSSGSSRSSRTGSSDAGEGRRDSKRRGGSRRHRGRHAHSRRADAADPRSSRAPVAASAPSPQPTAPSVAPAASQLSPWPVYACVPQQLSSVAGGPQSGVFDRIATLEQAVASLTQTVQHQREDIMMMKRLLLQQTQERRKEAEHARQQQQQQQQRQDDRARDEAWQRRLDQERRERLKEQERREEGRSLVPVPQAATAAASLANGRNLHLSHHHVDVDFPEDALRGFVQAVLEDKMKKILKKSESKILNRLDAYLHDVVSRVADSVDERVRWHLAEAEEQQQQQRRRQRQHQQPPRSREEDPQPLPSGRATAFPFPPMSIEHTMLSGSSAMANNVSGASGATGQPRPPHPSDAAISVGAGVAQAGGAPSSGAPSPVLARAVPPPTATGTGAAVVAEAYGAPAVGGPSPHRYDTRPPSGPHGQQQQQPHAPQAFASNRYLAF